MNALSLFPVRLVLLGVLIFRPGAGRGQGNSPQTVSPPGGTEKSTTPAVPVGPGNGSTSANGNAAEKQAAVAAQFAARRPEQIKTLKEATTEAGAHLQSGNFSEARSKLAAFNFAKPGTPEWHLETTARMVDIAESFARKGNAKDAKTTIGIALAELDSAGLAAAAAGDKSSQSCAKAASARLHERFRGDPVAALADFEAALVLDPSDAETRAAYERLRGSYQNMLLRTKPAKK